MFMLQPVSAPASSANGYYCFDNPVCVAREERGSIYAEEDTVHPVHRSNDSPTHSSVGK